MTVSNIAAIVIGYDSSWTVDASHSPIVLKPSTKAVDLACCEVHCLAHHSSSSPNLIAFDHAEDYR